MNKRNSARTLLAVAAVVTIPLSLLGVAASQVPQGLEAESMAIPAQAVENAPVASDDPFADQPAPPSFSAVSALQADAAEQAAELSPRDYFRVTLKDAAWEGHSRRSKFRAVAVALQNTRPVPLEIMQAEVINGLDEQQVSEGKIRAQELKQQAMNFLMRGSGMVSGFGVIGANNYGASAAMSPVPAMNFANRTQAAAAPAETAVSSRFISQFEHVTVNPHQVYRFNTLVPVGTEPLLRMTFRDLKTGQVVTF